MRFLSVNSVQTVCVWLYVWFSPDSWYKLKCHNRVWCTKCAVFKTKRRTNEETPIYTDTVVLFLVCCCCCCCCCCRWWCFFVFVLFFFWGGSKKKRIWSITAHDRYSMRFFPHPTPASTSTFFFPFWFKQKTLHTKIWTFSTERFRFVIGVVV